MRRTCIFCSSTSNKITREHAWPNWIEKHLAAADKTIALQRADTPTREWRAPAGDMGLTVNAVCKPCNEGWLHRMEQRIEPILGPMMKHPTVTQLRLRNQQRLSIWLYKTAILLDLTNSPDGRYFTKKDRADLYQHRSLPAEQPCVWLARFVGVPTASVTNDHLFFDAREDRPDRPTDAYCTTMTVGQVAAQILSWHGREQRGPLTARQSRVWDDAAVAIWPPSGGAVTWPPRLALDGDGLSRFTDRFRTAR